MDFEGGLNLEWPGTYKNAVSASRGTAFWEVPEEKVEAVPNVGIALIQSESCISRISMARRPILRMALHLVSIYQVPVMCQPVPVNGM